MSKKEDGELIDNLFALGFLCFDLDKDIDGWMNTLTFTGGFTILDVS